ncbi:hypothetical protein [Mycobacterium riyadhense]|uniref:aromatic-ring hydroxylase C-terminal domain-containing protein n=1 Tax=Mycobacterium riyadhense TaxID=486698 RepID=UPI0033905AB9
MSILSSALGNRSCGGERERYQTHRGACSRWQTITYRAHRAGVLAAAATDIADRVTVAVGRPLSDLPATAVLVRPDGYVVWASSSPALDAGAKKRGLCPPFVLPKCPPGLPSWWTALPRRVRQPDVRPVFWCRCPVVEEEIPVNHEVLFQEVETVYTYPVYEVDTII